MKASFTQTLLTSTTAQMRLAFITRGEATDLEFAAEDRIEEPKA
jgi:hypothetical protein